MNPTRNKKTILFHSLSDIEGWCAIGRGYRLSQPFLPERLKESYFLLQGLLAKEQDVWPWRSTAA